MYIYKWNMKVALEGDIIVINSGEMKAIFSKERLMTVFVIILSKSCYDTLRYV